MVYELDPLTLGASVPCLDFLSLLSPFINFPFDSSFGMCLNSFYALRGGAWSPRPHSRNCPVLPQFLALAAPPAAGDPE